jgi:hypothetical protein
MIQKVENANGKNIAAFFSGEKNKNGAKRSAKIRKSRAWHVPFNQTLGTTLWFIGSRSNARKV